MIPKITVSFFTRQNNNSPKHSWQLQSPIVSHAICRATINFAILIPLLVRQKPPGNTIISLVNTKQERKGA